MLLTISLLALALLHPAGTEEPRTADDLIARAVETLGGQEQLDAIQSLRYMSPKREGRYQRHMVKVRANLRIVGCIEAVCGYDDDYVEGYDGIRGWEVNLRKQRLIRTRGHAETALRCGSYLFPYFVGYRERGWTAEFVGKDVLRGAPVYVLRITPAECQVHTYYIAQDDYRVVAERRTSPLHARGKAIDTLVALSDHRRVAGVLFPHNVQELDARTAEPLEGVAPPWERIEANTLTDTSIFQAPQVSPGPGTQLVVDMLAASETKNDDEVLAMHREFRGRHPQMDIEEDLDWLGHELLKADRFPLAIAVFKTEIREYPKSFNAWDSLGDAYAQMGDVEQARAAYGKAVAMGSKGSGKKLEQLQ
jgi:hypothetical protein